MQRCAFRHRVTVNALGVHMDSQLEEISMSAAKKTTDHEEIRRWAERHGAQPATVKRTRSKNDVGLLRLDFPGFSGEGSLQSIGWDEWFSKFDEQRLALLYQDGKNTNFNKLVRREPGERRASDSGGTRTRASRTSRVGRSSRAPARRKATSLRGRSVEESSAQSSGGRRTRPTNGSRAAAPAKTGSNSRTRSARSTLARNGSSSRNPRANTTRSTTGRGTLARGTRGRSVAPRRGRASSDLGAWTKAELLERARSVGLEKRSSMNKAELVQALQRFA
jgi:hypothetical protein